MRTERVLSSILSIFLLCWAIANVLLLMLFTNTSRYSLKPFRPLRTADNEDQPPPVPFERAALVLKEEYDVCVIGAGFSGTVFAERSANVLKKSVLVIDERHHVGGNCFDYVDEPTGILMNKYGAHLFHTNDEKAHRYVTMHKQAPEWVRWDHKVVGWVNNRLVPIPVNIETVNVLLNQSLTSESEMKAWLATVQEPCEGTCKNAEEMAKSRVGAELYDKIFKDYTFKQWARAPRDLDALVTARIPVRTDFDGRYFSDKYQLLPSQGYTKFFEALLRNELIQVELGVDFFRVREDLERRCQQTIYTGPIDKYFQDADTQLPSLEYRSIEFVKERHFGLKGYKQPNSVVNYPSKDTAFTRIVEYKHFLHQKSEHTVTVKEFSKDEGDPYYPVPNPRNLKLYEQYQTLAKQEEELKNVYFVGRLANYKYFNMDAAIVNALDLFFHINGKPYMEDMADLFA